MNKQRPVCRECGNHEIAIEATAHWDDEKGEVVVGELCDKGHYCEQCGGEVKLVWVDTLTLTVTPQELATMLAALQYWQNDMDDPNIGGDLYDVATDGGKFEHLTSYQIDLLCMRINR